jgi:DNA-binding MarR family transcriptional regulator
MTTKEMKRELVLALQRLQRREDFRQLKMVKPLSHRARHMTGQSGMGGMRGLLEYLSEQEGPVLNIDIAEEFDVKPSSVTMLINKAEASGFVTRVDDANDRRRKRISITEEGLAFIGGRRQNQDTIIDGLFNTLTDEDIETLLHLVNKLNEAQDIPRDRPNRMGGPRPRPGQEAFKGMGRNRDFARVAAEEAQLGHFAQQVKERSERYLLLGDKPYREMSPRAKNFVRKSFVTEASGREGYVRLDELGKSFGMTMDEFNEVMNDMIMRGYLSQDPHAVGRYDSTEKGRLYYHVGLSSEDERD